LFAVTIIIEHQVLTSVIKLNFDEAKDLFVSDALNNSLAKYVSYPVSEAQYKLVNQHKNSYLTYVCM
jgi:hypothetical protein